MDAGRCANCGEPILSSWYCMDCLNKKAWGALGMDWDDDEPAGLLRPHT